MKRGSGFDGGLTFLSIEEEESLAESDGIIIRRSRLRLVFGKRFSDDNRKADDQEGDDDGANRPFKSLPA